MDDIKEKQAKLLSMLKLFDQFARENDILYYVSAGTCLGAIRENGFIPWDADIDIMLPMDMYKKCESLLLENNYQNKICWLSYKNNQNAPNLMGRIYEVSLEIDNIERFPYLDIFALAGMPNDIEKAGKIIKRSLMNYRIYWIKKRNYSKSLSRKKSKLGFILQKLLILYPAKACIKEFEKQMCQFPYVDAEYVAPLTGLYGHKEIVPKKWFDEEPDYVSFCDMVIPVTKYVNDYLSHLYGKNFMTPVKFSRYN